MALGEWPGIALPWGPRPTTLVTPKGDIEVLKSSVYWILLTSRGERVMLPEFGSKIMDAPFEPNDDELVREIRDSAQEAISTWDDRIEFVDLTAEASEESLHIKVEVRSPKDPRAEATQYIEFELTPSMFGGTT